jgi:hypothetical protein
MVAALMADQDDQGRWICDAPGCTDGPFSTPQSLGGHRNKHRNEFKSEPVTVTEDGRHSTDNSDGTPKPDDPEYIPPNVPAPPPVVRPKVADGLVPWLSMLGMAVHSRNAYDGQVISDNVPNLVSSLDEVAQQNESLYRLLEGIKKGDSPNFRLALATLAILVPIFANHRPDSNALRSLTGALRMMPGTNIPRLPPRPDNVEGDTAADDMADKVQTMLADMPDEQMEAMQAAFYQMPPEVREAMMQQAATVMGGMAHPEMIHDVDVDSSDVSQS